MNQQNQKAPTQTEYALTAALTACMLNIKELHSAFERIAAHADHIPPPFIEMAVESTLQAAKEAICLKPDLILLSKKIAIEYFNAQMDNADPNFSLN